MIHRNKIKKLCDDFSLLNEDQQDYVLGILQALVFARESTLQETGNKSEYDEVSNRNR